jgi:hypothetical protein
MIGMVAASLMLSAGIAVAQDADEKSLEKCQKTAGKEIGKYAAGYQKTVAKCLDKISKELIKGAEVDASGAAKSCVGAFRKLENSEKPTKELAAKSADKISQKCDPAHPKLKAVHLVADVLGTGASVSGDAINADGLGDWCDSFGIGGGTVASVQDWIDCQVAAATCQARQQLVAEYPNTLSWLADVRTEIETLSLAGEIKATDALAALDELDTALDGDNDEVFDISCGPAASGGGGLLVTGQTTPYGTGSDGVVQAGTALSYTDNGDGTISDNATGLMWEKKDDSGSGLQDKDQTYTWSVSGNLMNGAITTTFLAGMNGGGGFAGYTDWRIPNSRELYSIVDLEVFNPSTDPTFHDSIGCTGCSDVTVASCSCTVSSYYWSSTTVANSPGDAWDVDFHGSFVDVGVKAGGRRVRAVRGGL